MHRPPLFSIYIPGGRAQRHESGSDVVVELRAGVTELVTCVRSYWGYIWWDFSNVRWIEIHLKELPQPQSELHCCYISWTYGDWSDVKPERVTDSRSVCTRLHQPGAFLLLLSAIMLLLSDIPRILSFLACQSIRCVTVLQALFISVAFQTISFSDWKGPRGSACSGTVSRSRCSWWNWTPLKCKPNLCDLLLI